MGKRTGRCRPGSASVAGRGSGASGDRSRDADALTAQAPSSRSRREPVARRNRLRRRPEGNRNLLMRSQDDPVRIRCGLAVDEKEELAVAALVGKTRFRQADTPNGEELRERKAAHRRRLDVDETALVVGVEWRDEPVPDAYPCGNDHTLAVDEDVDV